jgi:hypothetical protein
LCVEKSGEDDEKAGEDPVIVADDLKKALDVLRIVP